MKYTILQTISVILLILIVFVTPCQAQQRINIVRCCPLYGQFIEEDIYAFEAGNDAEDLVTNILDSLNMPRNFTLLAANVKDVIAVMDSTTRYVLYNTYFVASAEADHTQRSIVLAQLAHAVGHHATEQDLASWHPDFASVFSSEDKFNEIGADEFACSSLVEMGFGCSDIATIYNAESVGVSIGSLSKEERSARIEEFCLYMECGEVYATATRNGDDPPETVNPAESTETGNGGDGHSWNGDSDYPEFPWPPPKASAFARVPLTIDRPDSVVVTLMDAAEEIEKAFDEADYGERSYYSLPNGFALVSRVEQIDSEGKSLDAPARWSADVKSITKFSIKAYIRALFLAPEGHFRVIAFLVTDKYVEQEDRIVTRDEAQLWLVGGMISLPPDIGSRVYSDDHLCTALIYEFEKTGAGDSAAILCDPSEIPGLEHLKKSEMWAYFIR